MKEIGNIEHKIQTVSDTTTESDLTALRTELSLNCLAPEKLAQLRTIVEERKNLQEKTKKRLHELLLDCQKSLETRETVNTFDKAFEGTRSEILNDKNIQMLKFFILSKFSEFKNLNDSERDNLATATIDRLLSDKAFSSIIGDVSGGLVGVVKTLEKGGTATILSVFSSDDDEQGVNLKEEKDTKEKVESSATGLVGRIEKLIDSATSPLVELLRKNPVGLKGFLGNPKEITKYDNSGKINPSIISLSDSEKAEYMKNLNNRVLEVDGKIVPLETIKEKGMDFMATAPNWMQDIFKWLLNLPFIGNLLASFLGYKNGTEALSGMGEELRQRKSIMALREFRTINADGSKYEGKYAGKIDILKGKDISKINRKKLSEFFTFSQETQTDATKPDFWLSVFSDKKITTKDTEGKDIIYTVDIIKEDLDNDFKGLYKKLNEILDQKKKREYKNGPEKKIATEKQETKSRKQGEQPPEKPKEDKRTVLVKAFKEAESIPFSFGNETVDFKGGNLVIGAQKFTLKLSDGGSISPSVSSLQLIGADVKFGYLWKSISIERTKVLEGIGDLISMSPNSIKEINDSKGKLIITRVT